MKRLIDKSKKSNIKCEYCGNYSGCKCLIDGQQRNYWNRCKNFVWREDREYIDSIEAWNSRVGNGETD